MARHEPPLALQVSLYVSRFVGADEERVRKI